MGAHSDQKAWVKSRPMPKKVAQKYFHYKMKDSCAQNVG